MFFFEHLKLSMPLCCRACCGCISDQLGKTHICAENCQLEANHDDLDWSLAPK